MGGYIKNLFLLGVYQERGATTTSPPKSPRRRHAERGPPFPKSPRVQGINLEKKKTKRVKKQEGKTNRGGKRDNKPKRLKKRRRRVGPAGTFLGGERKKRYWIIHDKVSFS